MNAALSARICFQPLLDLLRVTEDQFGLGRRKPQRDLRDLRRARLGESRHVSRDQPGARHRADRHQAPIEEPAPGQPAEDSRAHVGVRAVLQVIKQVQQDDRGPVLAADLEKPLDRIMPAAQHIAVGRTQVRPAGQELIQDGLPVRQPVLEREPVDDPDRLAVVQLPLGTRRLQHEWHEVPFESRAAREIDQGTLQLRAALDQGLKRRLGVTVVHGCHTISLVVVLRGLRAHARRPRLGCSGARALRSVGGLLIGEQIHALISSCRRKRPGRMH